MTDVSIAAHVLALAMTRHFQRSSTASTTNG